MTTVLTRVCLNTLQARRTRREEALPETGLVPAVSVATLDPEHEAVLADSVGVAMQVVLETLSPPERLAFVLHDLFSVHFDEIAEIAGRSTDAVRQLASRARRRVAGRQVLDADLARQWDVVAAFSRRPVRATSGACCGYSIPMSCFASRVGPSRVRPGLSAALGQSLRGVDGRSGRTPAADRSGQRGCRRGPLRGRSGLRDDELHRRGGRIVEIEPVTDPEVLRAL